MGSRGAGHPPSWVRDAIFYEIFPDRFARSPRVRVPGELEPWEVPPTLHGFKGGNLPGIVEHLDDLAGLGITALYLTPIFTSASNHRYHTYDYLHVDPMLGGDAGLRELLDAAHAREMRVIIDGVFNHAGRGFWPFHHLLEAGARSPYLDWFHVDRDALRAGRRLRAYPEAADDPPLSPEWAAAHRRGEWSYRRLGYRAWWDLPALPKLNVENPEVRAYLLGVAEHWTRFGVDGWRFDVPEEVAPDFWIEMRERILALNPDAYLVGEVWRVAPEWVGPSGPFDGLMNYPLAWAVLGFAAGLRLDHGLIATQSEMRQHVRPLTGAAFLAALGEILAAYPPKARLASFNLLGSHDTPRLRSVCSDDPAATRLALLLLASMPGAPCIYYGDEVGMRGGPDPACRGGYPWGAGDRDIRTRELLVAATAARGELEALRGPELQPLTAERGACAFLRGTGPNPAWVVVNAGDEVATLALPNLPSAVTAALAVGEQVTAEAGDDGMAVRIPARSGAVLVRSEAGR